MRNWKPIQKILMERMVQVRYNCLSTSGRISQNCKYKNKEGLHCQDHVKSQFKLWTLCRKVIHSKKRTRGRTWQQVNFNDRGSYLDLCGLKKTKKNKVKITLKVPDDLEVINVQGNPVNILGWAYYFISLTENGAA